MTHFTPQRNKLLAARIQQQQDIDNGTLPDFISETASIRDTDWKIRGIPADLQDRRVEITGPVERKMVINALNANVKVFMADFEDSLAPDWNKVIDGQINLRDAVNGTISYTNEAGKIYQLKPNFQSSCSSSSWIRKLPHCERRIVVRFSFSTTKTTHLKCKIKNNFHFN